MQDYNARMKPEQQVATRSFGFRVRSARDAMGLSQEALSNAMGFADRQTLSAIENGERAVRPDEIVRLCHLLGQNVDYFIDPFGVSGEAEFSWTADAALPDSELKSFEVHAGQWVGMLRFLRRWNSPKDPFAFSLRLGAQPTLEEALALGEAVVKKMKLGSVPSACLNDKIVGSLGIEVLFIDVPHSPLGSISAATCHLPDLDVILINRNEPDVKRNHDLAHGLFRAVTWNQMKPSHRGSIPSGSLKTKNARIEKLADSFASGLLMPKFALDKAIDTCRINDKFHLVDVADRLCVSPTALAYRLFNAGLIDQDLCTSLCKEPNRGITQGHQPKRFSSSFMDLLRRGIECGHVSVRKTAKALGLTLEELEDLFAEHSSRPPPFAL